MKQLLENIYACTYNEYTTITLLLFFTSTQVVLTFNMKASQYLGIGFETNMDYTNECKGKSHQNNFTDDVSGCCSKAEGESRGMGA